MEHIDKMVEHDMDKMACPTLFLPPGVQGKCKEANGGECTRCFLASWKVQSGLSIPVEGRTGESWVCFSDEAIEVSSNYSVNV